LKSLKRKWSALKYRVKNNPSYAGVENRFIDFQQFADTCNRTDACEQCTVPLIGRRDIHRTGLHYCPDEVEILCASCHSKETGKIPKVKSGRYAGIKRSEKCKKERNAKRREAYRKKVGSTIGERENCSHCERSFTKRNSTQNYCSRVCYRRAKSGRQSKANNKRRTLGGKYAWRHMRDRCTNPRHPSFHLWGGKGVEVKFADYDDFAETYFRTEKCEWCNCHMTDENRNLPHGRTMHRIIDRGHYAAKNVQIICRKCHNDHHNSE